MTFVALLVAAVALGSAAHVAFTYSVWVAAGGPTRPRTRLVVAVSVELLLTFIGALTWPLGLLDVRPKKRDSDDGVPVILLHGYLMTWANFVYLWPAMSRNGLRSIHPVTIKRWLSGTNVQIELLSRAVDAVLERTGASQVDIVAHSMGGVLSRGLAGRDLEAGRSRIHRIVTLGTPHHGTRLAELALGRGGRAMRRGSRFLASLPPPREVTSIWSTHDNLVVPAESGDARGIVSFRLEGLGHFSLLFSSKVATLVVKALRSDEPSSSSLAESRQGVRAGEADA
ncbi:MAG: alpha/beta fold hydrolase [Deltaproteobacteria bacterium]|nr:alpha/beta fold hydrolase [Deltaproteobacteria bacterium]